jgi:hypothetical protein
MVGAGALILYLRGFEEQTWLKKIKWAIAGIAKKSSNDRGVLCGGGPG